jgi:hypothetical protein
MRAAKFSSVPPAGPIQDLFNIGFPKDSPSPIAFHGNAQHFEMVEVNSTFMQFRSRRWSNAGAAVRRIDLCSTSNCIGCYRGTQPLPNNFPRNCAPWAVRATMKRWGVIVRKNFAWAAQTRRSTASITARVFSEKTRPFGARWIISKLSAYSLAIEFRNRRWVVGNDAGATFAFLRRHAVTLVMVDAPRAKHFTILPSELDETTNPCPNYLRLHGRNAEAYLKGKTVATRFDYDYSDKEIEE